MNESVILHRGHYTGTWTTKVAQSIGHPIWSSEDYSHSDDDNGAGCLARVWKSLLCHSLLPNCFDMTRHFVG